MSDNYSYPGFMYGATESQRIYPSPKDSPGKYKSRPALNREIKRSISQYDHAELISLSAAICCRIPALRAAIRDKNSWAFANWLPVYMGDNDAWGEAAEEYLTHEVLPTAMFRELREDFAWGMRVSGMGLDIHGDDLCIFTEDEYHNPKVNFVPSPRIGNGPSGAGWVTSVFGGATLMVTRADGMGVVQGGQYDGLPIYNGVIRLKGKPIAVRCLGFDDNGVPSYLDVPLGMAGGAHYACEQEFFGLGRGIPRPAASILHWMKKEEIDDQFLKGLANAAQRAVIHKLAKNEDATTSRGNAVDFRQETITKSDGTTEEKAVFVEYSQDGNVQYIGADEELGGISFENPHPNAEAFAVRVLMECLADMGWSYALLDTSSTSRAPTRLEAQKANNSIAERQSIEEIRSVRFFQYAIAKGMANGRIPKNDAGIDPYKWGVGFPAALSIDQGNDVTAALNRLRMGLTNERIEAAKDGYIAKHIRRQREKEVKELALAADRAYKFVQGLGHKTFTYDQAMALFYQPSPNPPTPQVQERDETVNNNQTKPGQTPKPAAGE